MSLCSFSGILHRITCGLHLYHFQDVKTFNKTMTLYSNSILYPINGKESIPYPINWKEKLLLPQIHNFKFSILLEIECWNFLCTHNTLLTGTAEWVNLKIKFWKDNHTKACNQNSSFRDWQCSLTTNKAIYKNVKQVMSIHRQSKKRQYHACFYNSTS